MSVCSALGLVCGCVSLWLVLHFLIDYMLEVTENKALKPFGGIIEVTHNDCAQGDYWLDQWLYAKAYALVKSNAEGRHTETILLIQAYNTAVDKMIILCGDDTLIDPFPHTFPPTMLLSILLIIRRCWDVTLRREKSARLPWKLRWYTEGSLKTWQRFR